VGNLACQWVSLSLCFSYSSLRVVSVIRGADDGVCYTWEHFGFFISPIIFVVLQTELAVTESVSLIR
jgi:hypothetical protein